MFNSHGAWVSVAEIRELEVEERGNEFNVPEMFDACPCIWVALDPITAYEYYIPADRDYYYHSLPLYTKLSIAEEHVTCFPMEVHYALFNYDGDGGFLLVDLRSTSKVDA